MLDRFRNPRCTASNARTAQEMPAEPASSPLTPSGRGILRWWAEAGVDIAIDETPHDRFAERPPGPGRPRPRA